ncbi:transcriptional repressor LexA [Neomegalonema sp.]|uniref:transcriptional repressor LexA n=1 Tax=Neomegalonema sp. TaxID=2039713 RepID=UPI00261CC6EF|nr:transcriptional repressor LexA [Neomegalonema sp.]MDD2867951.1 transcriptional repressor LexA [Neomegalonema sp.]
MLTRKQYQLLVFIDARIQETGISPSFDEMKVALSLKSKSGIHRLIMALEERGFIHRLPHRARALEVLKRPDRMERDKYAAPASAAASPATPAPSFRPSLVEGRKPAEKSAERPLPPSGVIEAPLIGRVAAGVPILAESNIEAHLAFPAAMVRKGGPYYALRVKGDSMIDMGIRDGDVALISSTDTAETGDVVVALVGEEEATLKRFRRRGSGSIALEPANSAYETQIYRPEQVAIQGKLAGIFRSY